MRKTTKIWCIIWTEERGLGEAMVELGSTGKEVQESIQRKKLEKNSRTVREIERDTAKAYSEL